MIKYIAFFFILTALAIGVGLTGSDKILLNENIDNVSQQIYNISLQAPTSSTLPNIQGFYLTIEYGLKFVSTLMMETMRAGIEFGMDNPQFFTPEFVLGLMKLFVIALIISVLAKPLFYLGVIIVLLISKFWEWKKKK